MKSALVCCGCGGPAYFRKESRSGQAACFCARPHKEDCNLASRISEQNGNGLGVDQDSLVNPGQRIVIDFNSGEQKTIKHNDPDALANVGGRGGRFVGDGSRPNATMHRSLGSILKTLIVSGQFGNPRQTLEIEGIGKYLAADFFVPFHAVTEKHINQYHGYWGKVANAAVFRPDNSLWLNSGGRSSPSVRVREESIAELFRRLGINDKAALIGTHILALGELRLTDNSNKKYVRLTDLAYIAVHLS